MWVEQLTIMFCFDVYLSAIQVVRMYADNVDDDEEEDNFQSLGCHTCSLSTIVKRFHYMLDRMKVTVYSVCRLPTADCRLAFYAELSSFRLV